MNQKMGVPQPRLTPANLRKMIELQTKSTARDQALGLAAQFMASQIKGSQIESKAVVAAFFELAALLLPRLQADSVALKMAEVDASIEEENPAARLEDDRLS